MNGFLRQLQFLGPEWKDLLEIGIVTVLVYRILLIIRHTRAVQMLIGIVLLAGFYLVAVIVDLFLVRRLIEALLQYGVIAALIVFQPELRAALTRLGESRLGNLVGGSARQTRTVDSLVKGVEDLAEQGIGAIVAVQRETGLREYGAEARTVDAPLTPELLGAIFARSSPLHDGAVIVVGDKIQVAGAILPLTANEMRDRTLGTRHRAAIGLSEETDALVIVVSEETRRISVAQRGSLETGVNSERLRLLLERSFQVQPALASGWAKP